MKFFGIYDLWFKLDDNFEGTFSDALRAVANYVDIPKERVCSKGDEWETIVNEPYDGDVTTIETLNRFWKENFLSNTLKTGKRLSYRPVIWDSERKEFVDSFWILKENDNNQEKTS